MMKPRTTKSSKENPVVRLKDGIELYLPFNPVPASRPRVSRWGTYYGKTYKAYRDLADQLIPDCEIEPISDYVFAFTYLVGHKPKTTKLSYPRGDNDNFEKACWDAVVKKGYLKDDDLIAKNYTEKRFVEKGEEPHTIIQLIEIKR